MEKITQMHDSKIGIEYDVYKINARALAEMVSKSYQLSKIEIQKFNGQLKLPNKYAHYPRILMELKAMEAGVQRIWRGEETLRQLREDKKTIEKMIDDGTIFTEEQVASASLGYELMPIAVSVKDKDFRNSNSKIELIDGFRRLFFTKEIPDEDVLVKVYDELNDSEWMKAMVVFNSWKFADRSTSDLFFDRGFKLGLYKRYGIDYTDLYMYNRSSMEQVLDLYVGKSPYHTLWGNDKFVNDLKLMHKISMNRPKFEYKTKRKEQVFDVSESEYDYPEFLRNINHRIFVKLGEVRRSETKKVLNGEKVVRRDLTFEEYEGLLQNPDLQKHYVKMSEMQVGGHIDNYVFKHVNDYIESLVYNTPYETLVEEKRKREEEERKIWEERNKNFNINDIILD